MRKKVFAVFLAAVLWLMSVPVPAAAADAGAARVIFSAGEADGGGCFDVAMTICSAKFNVFSFALRYDPSTVVPVDSSGSATAEFSRFAEREPDLSWLSTIGDASVNTETGLISMTGFYVAPGSSPTTDGLTPAVGYAVVGDTGLRVFTFHFKRTGSSPVILELATKSETKPYISHLPEGGAMYDTGEALGAVYTVVLPSSLGTGSSSVMSSSAEVEEDEPSGYTDRLKDTIILQLGNDAAAVDGSLTQIYSGESSVVPYAKDERTFVPLRFISERLGAQVDWDQETKTVTITRADTVIIIRAGENYYTKNGTRVEMDTQAEQLLSAPGYYRTMVPIRFIAEALGRSVEWDQRNQLVIIAPGDAPWALDGTYEKQITTSVLTLLSPLTRDLLP